jgi:acyl-coenzyme A thioesterase 13
MSSHTTLQQKPMASTADPPARDPAAVLSHVQAHWAKMQPNSPIYNFFFAEIAFASAVASPQGRIVARFPVRAAHVNSKGGLHGAVSAALVDWAGGMALAASGLEATGVSVDIHVSYAAAAREGDEIEVEGWVVRRGRTLGFTGVAGGWWLRGVIRSILGGRRRMGRRGLMAQSYLLVE